MSTHSFMLFVMFALFSGVTGYLANVELTFARRYLTFCLGILEQVSILFCFIILVTEFLYYFIPLVHYAYLLVL